MPATFQYFVFKTVYNVTITLTNRPLRKPFTFYLNSASARGKLAFSSCGNIHINSEHKLFQWTNSTASIILVRMCVFVLRLTNSIIHFVASKDSSQMPASHSMLVILRDSRQWRFFRID